MGDGCRDCKTMEEDIYWRCFQTFQFSQILTGHFAHQLEVPKRFAQNLREKLGKEVSLKVPSGAIWTVGLKTVGDSLYFNVAWKEFIEDNSLEENDVLIFKYNGSSAFDVLLFDGKSLCEKEASYFVRRCAHPGMARERGKGEKETSENTSRKLFRRFQPADDDGIEKVEETFHGGSKPEDDSAEEWTPNKLGRDDAAEPKSARRRAVANRKFWQMKKNSTHAVSSEPLEYISNRRPVTHVEKENAIQRAYAETSDESLVIVMKEYNIMKCHLTMPAWWSNDRLPDYNVTIKLQVKEKIWPVKFVKKSHGSALYAGWKQFALDNSLEVDDVCLFCLVSEKLNPIVIDVKIFRVVEEMVPPKPLCPAS